MENSEKSISGILEKLWWIFEEKWNRAKWKQRIQHIHVHSYINENMEFVKASSGHRVPNIIFLMYFIQWFLFFLVIFFETLRLILLKNM